MRCENGAVKQFIGIQYNTTGISGYSFREKGTEVFDICCPVCPNPNITLSGFGRELSWRGCIDNITSVYGTRRNVIDESGYTQGYYEYTDMYEFEIVTNNVTARVRRLEEGWNVYVGAIRVAEFRRIDACERRRFEENGYEMEEWFRLNIIADLRTSIYPFVMAIPLLGF